MGETIEIEALSGEGRFAAYCARPAADPKAAIIVIQEIFGVNAGIRRKADDWAALGYLALAPDMFWRFAPGYDVDPDVPEQRQDAFGKIAQFDMDKAIGDVEALVRHARGMTGRHKVGIVGFCMGGSVAYLAATRTDVAASVGYYGGQIGGKLDEARAIAAPLMLHFAGNDAHITPDVVARVHAALDGNAHVTIHDYPGVDHGFADTFGQRRSDAAAREADARTIALFEQALA